jgi:hypothetical protein
MKPSQGGVNRSLVFTAMAKHQPRTAFWSARFGFATVLESYGIP